MAKTPGGIHGKASGKLAQVVYATWKGIAYAREYVIPANPDTPDQKTERELFADLVWLGQALLGPVLQVFWDPFLRRVSGWAHFIGVNRKLYAAHNDFSTVKISQGTLESTPIITAVYAAGNVNIVWDDTVVGNGALTDAACGFVYDEVNKVGFADLSKTRDDELVQVAVGTDRVAANLNAWLFFADSATAPTKVSISDHAQVTV